MRVGPEIKRGAGRKWEGAFDFLALFGSFWGDAKKNRTLEVKPTLNFRSVFFVRSTFSTSTTYEFSCILVDSRL
jgi:hypothetical protein